MSDQTKWKYGCGDCDPCLGGRPDQCAITPKPKMSTNEREPDDLENTNELFDFLQGKLPDGFTLKRGHIPKLTADQAWRVIWYLGNKYWQVTDHVERCDVCGTLYDEWNSGSCLDYGKEPYHFCDTCMDTAGYDRKFNSKLNPDREK